MAVVSKKIAYLPGCCCSGVGALVLLSLHTIVFNVCFWPHLRRFSKCGNVANVMFDDDAQFGVACPYASL